MRDNFFYKVKRTVLQNMTYIARFELKSATHQSTPRLVSHDMIYQKPNSFGSEVA